MSSPRVDVPRVDVRDDAARGRYEVFVDEVTAGYAAYRSEPGRVVFTHTRIQPGFEGQGLGSALARAALDDVRRRGLQVTPLCPFIHAYIGRHPEYAGLVAAEHRSSVGSPADHPD